MSASYWLQIDTGGPEPATVADDIGVTYNLTPMLRAAGFPGHKALAGGPASEAAGMLGEVSRRLLADRERLIAEFTPANGWGNWENAHEFICQLRDACEAHPRATIGASL